MNPFAFEFKSSYLAFLACQLLTNRFFEFVQAGLYDEDDHPAGLPSVFNKEFTKPYFNKAFEKNLSVSLAFDPRGIEYWDEYFGQYRIKRYRSS